MVSLLSCLSLVLLPLAPGAGAPHAAPQPVAAPGATATSSVFFGKWELDLTRMPDSYGPPPKRVLFEFADLRDGRWQTTIDITDRDDSIRHMAVAYRPDGSTAPITMKNSEADSVAVLLPVPDVLILNLGRAKTLGSVRVYTMLAGGNEMIESAAALTSEGQPFVRTFHFKRVR